MIATFKTAALSAMIGLTALTGAAHADSLTFRFGDDPRVGVYLGDESVQPVNDWRRDDGDRGRGDDWRRGDWRRGDRGWDRDGRRWDRACTPERAIDKAERMGLRRVRIEDVSRRTIEVSGRAYGDRQFVTFARAPHCPVIR